MSIYTNSIYETTIDTCEYYITTISKININLIACIYEWQMYAIIYTHTQYLSYIQMQQICP